MICAAGHSFDIARTGYLNLLQPQDRRSKSPGDSTEAVAARRRLHERGVMKPLVESVANFVQDGDVVLDAGCGEGTYLGTIAAKRRVSAHGVDISVPAIAAASRRYPEVEWVVANADRMLPYLDATFTIVLSITARMNPTEFHRVLQAGGRLLVGVPAPDDLIELRGQGRERVERTIAEFTPLFRFESHTRVTSHVELDAPALEDFRLAIYRPRGEVSAHRVTMSLDLLLFKRD